jgi:hypothetical protein
MPSLYQVLSLLLISQNTGLETTSTQQFGSGIQALELVGGRLIFVVIHYIQVYRLYYCLDFKADIMPLARAEKSFQDIRRSRPDNKTKTLTTTTNFKQLINGLLATTIPRAREQMRETFCASFALDMNIAIVATNPSCASFLETGPDNRIKDRFLANLYQVFFQLGNRNLFGDKQDKLLLSTHYSVLSVW